MKTEIINEIDSLIQLSKDLDNAYMKNKLRDIKKLLLKEWNESDLYYEQIREVLKEEETMNNLNNLMDFKK
jgi:hypothetical protein